MKRWGRRIVLLTLGMAAAGQLACFDAVRANAADTQADPPAVRLQRALEQLWEGQLGAVPASPALLLLEAHRDEVLRAALLEQVDDTSRALTDTLLGTLALSEPQARRLLPGLHVARDSSPPPGERPPTWADVRNTGLLLLRGIALDSGNARDVRLARDLDAARAEARRMSPSVVGGLVELWKEWWVDRGDDPSFYLHPDLVPSVRGWLRACERPLDDPSAPELIHLLPRILDQPLRARLFLEALDRWEHAGLAAEAIDVLEMYRADLESRGVPLLRWDADEGQLVGHDPRVIRQYCADILTAVTPHLASGVNEDAVLLDWLRWWLRARYEARYYRQTSRVPGLDQFLEGLDRPAAEGGKELPEFLRAIYVDSAARELVFDKLGPRHRGLVAELIEWLAKDRSTAVEDGFIVAYRRPRLRPMPGQQGEMVAILWPRVQDLIRDLLTHLTDYEPLAVAETTRDQQIALWREWWRSNQYQPQWYRDGNAPERPRDELFRPVRARADG